jgi:uncharacterized protein YndB with AHSA1/START domain
MAAKNKPNEIYIIRIYDAPVKMVWDAWVDPKQVAQWWGPRGFTLTSKSKDVIPGGKWIYTMHGPDGTDWPNVTVFHEVEKYSRLVYDHGANENQPALFRVTVEFTENQGKTKMEMTMALATAEAAKETKKFIKSANGDSTWDRLAEYLAAKNENKDIFVTHCSFEAPLDLVWDMWTNPKHVAKWLPPTGMTMEYIKADISTGGTSHYSMSGNGMKMYGKAHYREMTKPSKLVYTQIFVDEKETISRHPMAPTWPETMLTTVLFEAEGVNQTRVNIRWEIDGNASAAEIETFNKAKTGMTQGWSGSFDKLDNHLKTV